MSIFDNHSAFNNWKVATGYRINTELNVSGYLQFRKYARNLKADLPYSIKELIVNDINSQKQIRIIGISNIDTMIDILLTVGEKKAKVFDELKKKDFFEAFRYLHKLTFG
jgi:hypothetical protein